MRINKSTGGSMIELDVTLANVLVSPDADTDWGSLALEEAERVVHGLYSFLQVPVDVSINEGVAHITIHHEPRRPPDESTRLYARAVKHAESGRYERAIGLLQTVVRDLPMLADARRNLGMALLESGQVDKAEQVLIEAVRLFPADVWGYLLLGNLYAKQKRDFALAEKCYKKALAIEGKDPFTLTSYAGLCAELKRYQEAERLFRQAIATGQVYPNTYYGLALVQRLQGRDVDALATLDDLFEAPRVSDRRYASVYTEAQNLYLGICAALTAREHASLMEFVDTWRRELELELDYPIELVPDDSLKDIQAVAQSAWRHHRDAHVVRYSPTDLLVVPHLIAHELEHLFMEHEDRQVGRNRLFASSNATREYAIRSLEKDVLRLARKGYSHDTITEVILQLVDGLVRQLFSCPLDMVLESRLFNRHPRLRRAQLVSLDVTSKRALAAVTNPEIQKSTPRFVYRAVTSMNCAYALFIDTLFAGRTSFADAYPSAALTTARKLLALWRETMTDYRPGAEYDLVDGFAELLGMNEWFEWKTDESQSSAPEGAANPELLKQKEPATVMYLLGALERFEDMAQDQVFAIGSEIALLGRRGLDYASSDAKYTLNSLPDERFTGLQLLCLMYVSFQKADPSLDLGLDFKDAYQTALALYEGTTQ